MVGFNNLAQGFTRLTDIMHKHFEHEDEVQKLEQEVHAKKSERLNDMLCLIFLQKSNL